jgi:hypothetical protein
MINMADESNVRIFQIGSEGFNEYEGVSSSLQPNNHTTSTPVVDKRSPSDRRSPSELRLELRLEKPTTKKYDITKQPDYLTCNACNQQFKTHNAYIRHLGTLKHKNNIY